jgi:SPW repeat
MISRRWQAWINYLLGVWLFTSPWALGYLSSSSTATWNAWVLGVAIIVFAAIGVLLPKVWEQVINIILGVWMVVSAWVLGFDSVRNAESNAVIVGLLVIIFATWAFVLNRQTVGHRKAIQPYLFDRSGPDPLTERRHAFGNVTATAARKSGRGTCPQCYQAEKPEITM